MKTPPSPRSTSTVHSLPPPAMPGELAVGLIYGSTREGRFCDTVARWVGEEMTAHGGFHVDPIDPLALQLPARHESVAGPATLALRRRLAAADAFVIVTPEYNHAYPASLKFLIDSAYREWCAKPVAFVSYGGISGGLRAIEQLRLVFAELHAVTLSDTVSFANCWSAFDARGRPVDEQAARRALSAQLGSLGWWGSVLRDARTQRPYEQAAA